MGYFLTYSIVSVCTQIYEMFVYKTNISYIWVYISRKVNRVKKRNLEYIIFMWTWRFWQIFTFALAYLWPDIIWQNLRNAVPSVGAIIADLTLRVFVSVHLSICVVFVKYFMGISLSSRPVDQQRRQLAPKFYSTVCENPYKYVS